MEAKKSVGISRRDWLKGVAGLSATAAVSGRAGIGENAHNKSSSRGSADLIRRENQRPGTRDWLLSKTRIDPETKYRCPWIEGYCSRTSVRAGDTLSVFVSTNPASEFTLDLYCMGFYGGDGGREVLKLGPFKGGVQPDPPIGKNRLRECRWEPSTMITIPRN